MMCYHVFITSTFPLAAPLEWNLMFIYITAFLFLGYPAHEGYGLGDMDPVLLAVTAAALLFFPILGELRPRPRVVPASLRQYSGNWASAMWAIAPGAEAKLNQHIVTPAPVQKDQLTAMFDADTADVTLHQYLGWRALHSQGRGLNSVMLNQLGADIDVTTSREGELMCSAMIGWNFGDGHLHDQTLIEAIQKRCEFAPGELIVVYAESDPSATAARSTGSWTPPSASSSAAPGRCGRRRRAAVAARRPDTGAGGLAQAGLRARQPRTGGARRDRAGILTSAAVVGSGPNGLAAALTLAAEASTCSCSRPPRRSAAARAPASSRFRACCTTSARPPIRSRSTPRSRDSSTWRRTG